MSEQEKINLSIRYLNGELDEQKEKEFLLMYKSDSSLTKLFEKIKEMHEFIEDLDDRILLNNWIKQQEPTNLTNWDEQSLTPLFKQWDGKSRNLTPHKFRYLFLLSTSMVAAVVIFLVFSYQSQQENTFSELETKTRIENVDEKKRNIAKTDEIEEDSVQDKEIEPNRNIVVATDEQDKGHTISPDTVKKEYPKNIQIENLIAGNFKSDDKWEINIQNIKPEQTKVIISFEYSSDSLMKKYTLQIEDYQSNDMYEYEISEKADTVTIDINDWAAGYYYCKLKTRGEIPRIFRFLKE